MMKNNQKHKPSEIVYVNESEEGKEKLKNNLPGEWSDIQESKDDDV